MGHNLVVAVIRRKNVELPDPMRSRAAGAEAWSDLPAESKLSGRDAVYRASVPLGTLPLRHQSKLQGRDRWARQLRRLLSNRIAGAPIGSRPT
jgi:hypothetical protein